MPSTRIETRAGWIGDRHEALIEAVHGALVEALRVPESDRCVRLLEYPAHAFATPPGRSAEYTVIEISMFAGRSIDAKRRLYAALARELGGFGIVPQDLKVVVHDEPRENWGLRGKAGTDIEIGFKIEV